jgi:hypothetical protein
MGNLDPSFLESERETFQSVSVAGSLIDFSVIAYQLLLPKELFL